MMRTRDGNGGRRSRHRWTVAVSVALVGLSIALAACGGSGSPGVASLGSTTTTTNAARPQAAGGAVGQQALAFTHCMRTHGVPQFPEPQITSTGISIKIGPGAGVDPRSATFRTAQSDCRSLLPGGGGVGPTITPADQADYLKGVACMRSHGFPAFPDPTISKNNVHFTVPSSINQNSTKFKSAVALCEKLIPAGLPYSGTN